MSFRLSFFLILTIAIWSCRYSATREKQAHLTTEEKQFNFYPFFPDTSIEKKLFVEERFREYRYFHLPSMLQGTDSFELRIWLWDAQISHKEVFIFRKGNEWSGSHYHSFTLPLLTVNGGIVRWKGKLDIGDSVFMVKEFIPQCGWEKFQDSIIFFGIERLPTQDSIPNLPNLRMTDGSGYDVEIGTLNSYRFLHYRLPNLYRDPTNQKFSAFIKMIKRELGQNYLWPLYEENK